MTVDGIILNCRDHGYGRYRALEPRRGIFFCFFVSRRHDGVVWWLGVAYTPTPTRMKPFYLSPRSCQLAKSRKTAILAVFPHFNGFLGKIERNGARGSIPTAILHRKRYVWVTLLNFYFLPTAPTKGLRTCTPSSTSSTRTRAAL